jgi:S-adenosylmethionine hydrolase
VTDRSRHRCPHTRQTVDDEDTIRCPYCGRDIYDDAERCRYRNSDISREDAPSRQSPWSVVGFAICLAIVPFWNFRAELTMADPIITLTTDFGEDSPYVAAMKGVILGINPAARLIDLSHQIPPQDVRHAAYFLAESIPYFPPEAIHVVVVDPGVGSERALLYVEIQGHRLLVPDNGCWTMLQGRPQRVFGLTERKYWRAEISNTFHGRDILAPVAAHLSRDVDAAKLGPVVSRWESLEKQPASGLPDGVSGEVIFVDNFGNLISNIPAAQVKRTPIQLMVGGQEYADLTWGRTYADVEPGRVLALRSSSGFIEIAVARGNAAERLGGRVGAPIVLRWKRE